LIEYERLPDSQESVLVANHRATIVSGPEGCVARARDVSSPSNPTFQSLLVLLSGRGIRKQGRALIAGGKIVAEVLARVPRHALAWITPLGGPPPPPEHAGNLEWLRLADALFKKLDIFGTYAPMLLVRVPEMRAWADDAPWPVGCTLFVPFQDPENVGAVIRSAAAFGVARVVLLREAAHPFHPRSARAAGPALFQVVLEAGPSIAELRIIGAPFYSLASDGALLQETRWPERFGLIAGLEGPGLPEPLRRGPRLRIAITPGVESLNAAAAVAIALYEWRRGGIL
jgi:tRNA(Leu) C34 or U34 (ribose-2'-O)-methylase TrmL